jgi:hypothetical protein
MNNKKNLFLIHETQNKFDQKLRNFLKFTTEAACQRNSSETTEQNFMKLGR